MLAWRRLAKTTARESYRFDRATRARLERNPVGVCEALAAQWTAGTYRTGPLRMVRIPKAGGGTRTLMVPGLLDRLIQSAAATQLSANLDSGFSPNSYAYRPRRSVAQARAAVALAIDDGDKWVVDADIRACFDEILHPPLIAALKSLGVWQHKTAWLLRQLLRAEVDSSAVATSSFCLVHGLPQGSPLSPLLCNVALHPLDAELTAAGFQFVRYADDFVVFADDERGAHRAMTVANETLAQLGLALHPNKTRIVQPGENFTFVGAQFCAASAHTTTSIDLATSGDEEARPQQSCDGATEEVTDDDAAVVSTAAMITPEMRAGHIDGTAQHRGERRSAITQAPLAVDDSTQVVDADAEKLKQALPRHDRSSQYTAEPLLRTLYLLEQRVTLERDGGTLVAHASGREPQRIPAARLHQVMAFGEVNLSSGAIALCLEHNIPVMLLGGRGKYFGVMDPIRIDNVSRQRAQFSVLDDAEKCRQVRNAMINGKLHNGACMLRRWARHRDSPHVKAALLTAAEHGFLAARRALDADNESSLRGIEGAAAAAYFGALSQALPSEWGFTARKRQPPPDPVNSLLSYGYVLLYYNLLTLVVARGLHPHLGFLHAARSGHHALVSDLMEEFRAPVVDALVMDIVSHRRLSEEDFTWPTSPDEPCLMSAAARRGYVHAFEHKLNAVVKLPGDSVGLDYRRRMDAQVLHLCGVLEGNFSHYFPFRIKG